MLYPVKSIDKKRLIRYPHAPKLVNNQEQFRKFGEFRKRQVGVWQPGRKRHQPASQPQPRNRRRRRQRNQPARRQRPTRALPRRRPLLQGKPPRRRKPPARRHLPQKPLRRRPRPPRRLLQANLRRKKRRLRPKALPENPPPARNPVLRPNPERLRPSARSSMRS